MVAPVLDVTPREALDRVQMQLGLSDSELAFALSVSSRTLYRWRKAQAYPQHEARARIHQLLELADTVSERFRTPAASRSWIETESRYLGGLTPGDAIRVGRPDRARAALEALDSGIHL